MCCQSDCASKRFERDDETADLEAMIQLVHQHEEGKPCTHLTGGSCPSILEEAQLFAKRETWAAWPDYEVSGVMDRARFAGVFEIGDISIASRPSAL